MRYKQYAVYFQNIVGFATGWGWVTVVVCHLEILIGQDLELVVLYLALSPESKKVERFKSGPGFFL